MAVPLKNGLVDELIWITNGLLMMEIQKGSSFLQHGTALTSLKILISAFLSPYSERNHTCLAFLLDTRGMNHTPPPSTRTHGRTCMHVSTGRTLQIPRYGIFYANECIWCQTDDDDDGATMIHIYFILNEYDLLKPKLQILQRLKYSLTKKSI